MERPLPSAADPATYANSAASDAPPVTPSESEKPEVKQRRTAGLKLFDIILYPIFTNLAVFGISVGATYLTSKGNDHGKIGAFFQKRGDWLMSKFKKVGMSHGQADMSKMVFFSFLDGSIMAPFVKLLEDRREKIGQWFDDRMGTRPIDDGVYEAEPKHSWLSVLGGRFTTAAIVVPTAVALDKIKIASKDNPAVKINLNDRMFNNPGAKLGEWMSKQPGIAKWFGKLDIRELSRIAAFELFYTSVCTAGLYFTSRRIARFTHRNDKPKEKPEALPVATEALAVAETPAPENAVKKITREKPQESFSETIAAERMAKENSPALAAH